MIEVGQARESSLSQSGGRISVRAKLEKLEAEQEKAQNVRFAPSVLAEQDNALLVAAAQSGINEAFEVLVQRHQGRIQSIARRFTRNREDAEDITQQTLQKAFVHLRRFEGNSSFSTWLTRIAINEALIWSRKKRGSSEVSLDVLSGDNGTATQLEPTDFAPNPEETCIQAERQRIISTAVNRLTPELRRATELREFAELSTKETAARMGLSVGAVKARLFHGRTKLRSRLKRYIGSKRALAPSRGASGIATNKLVFACK